jgi:GntR family transcriptional repressor for pyruvate dehydrogenase complex
MTVKPDLVRGRAVSAPDSVVHAVEARIAQEQLPPAFRIGTKAELGATYGVAPATLGEALRLLRARGVVDVRPGPGGGVFVAEQAPLSRLARQVSALREDGATANDVVAVLDALDEAVIRDAAVHRRASDLQDLERLGRRLARVWSDPIEGPRANWRLHRRIADISPNPILRVFYLNLVDYLEGELGDSTARPTDFDPLSRRRLQLHLDIIGAIRSGDEREIRAVVRRHSAPGG